MEIYVGCGKRIKKTCIKLDGSLNQVNCPYDANKRFDFKAWYVGFRNAICFQYRLRENVVVTVVPSSLQLLI